MERDLPEGWEWKRLEEIAEINSRFDKNSFDDETEVTFLPMKCVEELTGRMDTSIEKKYGEIKTGYTPIQEGDLLFAKITPCIENGKIAIAKNLKNGIGFASTEFHTLKFSPQNEIKFYFFYLMQEKIRQESARNMTGTAGQQRVPVTFLKRLKVPVPPLPIQRQIVAILERAEAVKRQRQEADALTGALLQSVFREMFEDPVRNEKRWPLKNIKEFSASGKNAIKAGPFGSSLKKECYTKTGFKIYGQEQVIKDDLQFGDYYISQEKYQELINYSVQAGDILISLVGSYGKISIVPESFEQGIINPRLMKISLNQELVLPIFFKYLFLTKAILNQIEELSHGGTMDIINVGIVKQLKFPVPPLALQQQFARVVESVERIRERQEESKREIYSLFDGLIQRAFGGELIA